MQTSLPPEFTQRVLSRDPVAGPLLLEALESERALGIRVNILKTTPEYIRQALPFPLCGVPWCQSGFYYQPTEKPSQHPLYYAGLYYMQEPSAMYTVEALGIEPGHRVLDLCAAPGGKSTQALAKLKGKGLLVANEISASRAKVLAFNLEKFGAHNFVVTNTSADKLASCLPGYFDRIIVDAPCSGEGMFRKEPETRIAWQPGHPAGCALRQQEILEAAVRMLRPGGVLAYSTCTFAEEENEWQVAQFIKEHSELELIPPPEFPGVEITTSPLSAKLLPHRLKGEGHYCALLTKKDGEAREPKQLLPNPPPPELLQVWRGFAGARISEGHLHMWGDKLSLIPTLPNLAGIRLERLGLKLGSFIKGRFEPDHALALSTYPLALPRLDYPAGHPALDSYLRGHVLECATSTKGWVLVSCAGHALGLGKASNGQVKNHLPKGLRLA